MCECHKHVQNRSKINLKSCTKTCDNLNEIDCMYVFTKVKQFRL